MITKPKGNEFFGVLWWRIKLYSKRSWFWLLQRNPSVRSVWGKLFLVWLECMLIFAVAGLALYVLSFWMPA